ncbi:hypothetical protein NDS46_19175 [Paenibacillus thiaminolyticus]|uniref:hypothetical protein n=1 Tax=Paenibacillus thiaminolyticus TaxID=49283 RepID=UPI00232F9B4E|nr:hypothetical protein [Paenibacillus thiaminolyticus]WCF06470.1 hypothetical protein NDS46_19175 [Paenibacillus thiaminolyticus]
MILHTPAQRKTHYLLQLLHSRNAAEEMRVFQNAPYLIGKWQRQFWKMTDERYQLEKTAGWRSLVVDSGHYVSLTRALVQIEGTISGLGRNIAGIYEESGENNIKFPEPLRSGIEVPDLTFAYTSQAPPMLKGVNLRIRPAEKIAIAGENGPGFFLRIVQEHLKVSIIVVLSYIRESVSNVE